MSGPGGMSDDHRVAMTFLRPDLAPWALLVPAIVAFWMAHRRFRGAFRRRLVIARRFAGLSGRSTGARDGAVLVAGVLTAAALALALVRPQATVTRRLPEYERQDLVIMLDRSASMKARDIQPSRFARATLEIRNFVRQKPDAIDRIALIGFADAAVVLSYLTEDADAVLFYFDWIDADPTPLFGTNIGAALKSAMDVAQKDDRRTRKLFLVVSDGEDYGTELARALVTARAEGYQVNCIGVGTGQAVAIPVRSADGQETLLRDDTGRPVLTRFAEGTLRDIATATGGQYVRSATGEELRRAIAGIVGGERRLTGWRTSTERRDLYPAFLAVAALAGAALWVLL
jgi:Ca-activated chloride channel family protein